MVQEVENLSAKLDVLRFVDSESLSEREIDVVLIWTAQNVAADIADIRSQSIRNRCAI